MILVQTHSLSNTFRVEFLPPMVARKPNIHCPSNSRATSAIVHSTIIRTRATSSSVVVHDSVQTF